MEQCGLYTVVSWLQALKDDFLADRGVANWHKGQYDGLVSLKDFTLPELKMWCASIGERVAD